jgi:hypothetical protein
MGFKKMRMQSAACFYPSVSLDSLCETLSYFDHSRYISECFDLGTYWFLQLMPGSTNPSVSQFLSPDQTDADNEKLAALYDYASRTDPNSVVRNERLREAWRKRRTGQKIVYLKK